MRLSIGEAVKLLQLGQVVALPTDTIYGLAAQVSNERAIEDLFALKKRSKKQAFVIQVSTIEEFFSFNPILPDTFHLLYKTFWPGGLTMVVPIEQPLLHQAWKTLSTIAFRIPNHDTLLAILHKVGPLAITSANRASSPPLHTAEALEEEFGMDFPVLEGDTPGIASTIISCVNGEWELLREGMIAFSEIKRCLQEQRH